MRFRLRRPYEYRTPNAPVICLARRASSECRYIEVVEIDECRRPRPAWSPSVKWATRRSCWLPSSGAVPISLGILVATLVNRAFVRLVGDWVANALGPHVLRWVMGLSFNAMAAWMLLHDGIDDEEAGGTQRFGVFGTTVVAFLLAEMGDKTQITTVALAAPARIWSP